MNRFGLLLALLAFIFCQSVQSQKVRNANSRQLVTTNLSAPVAGVKHVIWVWFENREITDISNATAPFFTSFNNKLARSARCASN